MPVKKYEVFARANGSGVLGGRCFRTKATGPKHAIKMASLHFGANDDNALTSMCACRDIGEISIDVMKMKIGNFVPSWKAYDKRYKRKKWAKKMRQDYHALCRYADMVVAQMLAEDARSKGEV